MFFKNKYAVPRLLLTVLLIQLLGGCEKMIEVEVPKNMLEESTVFKSASTANAAVNGMYSSMAGRFSFNYMMTVCMGMSADEMFYTRPNTSHDQFTANAIPVGNNSFNLTIWSDPYAMIYQANSIIEGLSGETAVADSLKKQYTGEAKFFRAFCHFYLVNLYGKVPLILTTNLAETQMAPRAEVDAVYEQIVADLKDAWELMGSAYLYSPTAGDRTRVNKFAAAALLARVYLYTNQWELAAAEATKVISNTSLYSLETDLATGSPFFKNSREAIWQWYSHLSATSGYTNQGSIFKPTSSSALAVFALRDTLLNAFEANDKRKTSWVTTYKPFNSAITYSIVNKYRFNSLASATAAGKMEGFTLLRLAELYLVRAEANARIGTDLESAKSDLNAIRNRAGLLNTDAADQAALLTAIAKERQIELFAELGHRWLDIKRTGTADALLKVLKPATWKETAVLWPVPEEAYKTNPNLLPQNNGY